MGITACNYWGVFPWLCVCEGVAVHLCVYDRSGSRVSDVEAPAPAALPLVAGLFRGPDGGAGVVNASTFAAAAVAVRGMEKTDSVMWKHTPTQ